MSIPASETQRPHSTPSAIGRRALLGLGLLVITTGGAAGLLYNSIEPGTEFPSDPDGARRNELLKQVRAWRSVDDLALVDPAGEAGQMLIAEASDIAVRKLSAAQRLVEGLQQRSDGGRRLILAQVVLKSEDGGSGRLPEQRLIDELVVRSIDGIFLDCGQSAARARAAGRAAEEALVATLTTLVERARLVNPNFLFVIENAAEIAHDPRLLRVLDGVARSDLLFGQDGFGVANRRTEVVTALHDLNRVRKSGRPVFITEHIPHEALTARAGARQTLSALGFVTRIEAARRPS